MGKPLPAHIIAAVVAARHIGDKSWVDISTALQIHPESARQAYNRAKERAHSNDILEILKCVYPLKSPGRPSKHRQADDPLQSTEAGTGDSLQQDTERLPPTSTTAQPKSHPKRRQELGKALANQKAKQKRRRIAEVEMAHGGEPRDPTRTFSGTVERPQGGGQQNMTKTFNGTVERPQGGEQPNPAKISSGNIGMPPAGAAARIQQSVGGMNAYGYGLGQLPEAMGQFALTYSHT